MNRRSEELFGRAEGLIPGGVNSPVRAFNSVGYSPIYIEKGEGAFLFDVDGKKYIDFCASWGPLILGHAHPEVVEAVKLTAEKGLSFGTCTGKEVEMAELLNSTVPYLEMVRMVNSGTEAVMSALRLARGYTGKTKIVKFDGCYHGHVDYMLLSAGSGLLTSPISSSAGISPNAVNEVIIAPYNNPEALEKIFEEYGSEIAAVIVEPVAGNMGLIEPAEGFLEKIRSLTLSHDALMIMDEVITGFRFGATTYGAISGIEPDLTCLGKILGGGMPIGAFGGKAEIMKHLAPLGSVYQAGTLSGNPVALAAGIATIKTLITENPYKNLENLGSMITKRVNDFARKNGLDIICIAKGGVFTIFFRGDVPHNLDEVKACDTAKFAKYHKFMTDHGIYLSPSQFELNFISTAHSEENIEEFLNTFSLCLDSMS
jgi:glutamate-1-semialdehyde 2,1-aminomutase